MGPAKRICVFEHSVMTKGCAFFVCIWLKQIFSWLYTIRNEEKKKNNAISSVSNPHPPAKRGDYMNMKTMYQARLNLGTLYKLKTPFLFDLSFYGLLTLFRSCGARTVNQLTLFLGRLRPPKQLTSTKCIYFRQ